ncbi:MAG: hypothetical protein ACQEW8_02370 [Actinomycetota bacterium]
MSDRDDVKQPLDHLPPQEERDESVDLDEPDYPDVGGTSAAPSVTPDTAAEPDKPNRHGVDRLPPTGR